MKVDGDNLRSILFRNLEKFSEDIQSNTVIGDHTALCRMATNWLKEKEIQSMLLLVRYYPT